MTRKTVTWPHSPAPQTPQKTLCTRCAFRFDFSHDCLSCEQKQVESTIGLLIIVECNGFVPVSSLEAVPA